MVTRIAAYGLSADPITFGHINLIERISRLYDKVLVVIAVNPNKTALLSVDEKETTVQDAVAHLDNVSVHICTQGYLVSHVFSRGAQVIIRGLRNARDFEDEETLAEENRNICNEVETLWVPCLPSLAHVSSSVVKGHIGVDASWEQQVRRLVPQGVLTLLMKKHYEARATKYWSTLMDSLGTPKGNKPIFERLLEHYREPHRFYHTLKHIVAMLDEFEEVSHLVKNPHRVRMAIWYHDAVYEQGDGTTSDEEKSAQLAASDLQRLGFQDEDNKDVCRLILMTNHKHHAYDVDAQVLLDLDLAILGKGKVEFDEYEMAISLEYSFVPKEIYTRERRKVLEMFRSREPRYHTTFFQHRYEATSQENLKRSLNALLA